MGSGLSVAWVESRSGGESQARVWLELSEDPTDILRRRACEWKANWQGESRRVAFLPNGPAHVPGVGNAIWCGVGGV